MHPNIPHMTGQNALDVHDLTQDFQKTDPVNDAAGTGDANDQPFRAHSMLPLAIAFSFYANVIPKAREEREVEPCIP